MRRQQMDYYDEEDDYSKEDEYDDEVNWAGGAGFSLGGEAHKWKSTRRICCWPLYSESITISQGQEMHIKRNACPALPRECRPFRSWGVTPLSNIKAYYMRKTVTKLFDLCVLFFLSLILGLIGGAVLAALLFQPTESLSSLASTSQAVGFNIDASFFICATIIGVAVCCLGFLALVLRSPLRLIIAVEGSQDPENFSIDFIPGRVQPEEIKAKIDEVRAGGGFSTATGGAQPQFVM